MKYQFLLILFAFMLAACGAKVNQVEERNNSQSNPETATTEPSEVVPSSTPEIPTETPTPSPPTATPQISPPGSELGETRVDEFGIEQVWVPAGTFIRGSDDAATLPDRPGWTAQAAASEGPQHEVTLTQGYWIDKYEVTNTAFQAFVDAGGYQMQYLWSEAGLKWLNQQNLDFMPKRCPGSSEPDFPRVCVTWFEAEAYAKWRGGQLPTEAQWEYAARGPESLIYPWGNTWDPALANVVDSEGLTAVGSYPEGASWVGALDMAGNAMEWVNDWLDWDYYDLAESVDPQGPPEGRIKIEKGGWWGAPAFVARSSYHHFEDPPGYQDKHIGFRIIIMPNVP